MEVVLSVLLGIGLAAACGFRVFVPLLVISIAAGVRLAQLGEWLPGRPVIRAMPNTPALIGAGVSAYFAAPGMNAKDKKQVEAILSWISVPARQARLTSLTLLAPELDVRRLAETRFEVAGMPFDLAVAEPDTEALQWLLEQRHIAISDAIVHYYDAAGAEPQRRWHGALQGAREGNAPLGLLGDRFGN